MRDTKGKIYDLLSGEERNRLDFGLCSGTSTDEYIVGILNLICDRSEKLIGKLKEGYFDFNGFTERRGDSCSPVLPEYDIWEGADEASQKVGRFSGGYVYDHGISCQNRLGKFLDSLVSSED